jgi:hypothetical protein
MSLIISHPRPGRPCAGARNDLPAGFRQEAARLGARLLPRLALSAFAVALAVHFWKQGRR